jgi:crotonobetainyl-CoA:carnitine CoA-transferase CaiB-like acyl-CoA transferase
MLATTTLAAIRDAEVNGVGRDFDISLLDAALHQTSYPAFWYLNEGHATERAPRSGHPYVTPSQTFRTADGWIFVMAQLPKFWTRLTETIGQPDLPADERFATPAARLENRDLLTREMDAVFAQATTAEWMNRLGGIVPVAPVRTMAEALTPEVAGDLITEVDHPARPGMKVLANPVRIGGERLPSRAGPTLGADSDALLAELGYSADDVTALRRDGAI